MSVQFRDSSGDYISLEELCRREPEWAADRIREMQVPETPVPLPRGWKGIRACACGHPHCRFEYGRLAEEP